MTPDLLTDRCLTKLARVAHTALLSRHPAATSDTLTVPLAWESPGCAGLTVATVDLPATVDGDDLETIAVGLAEGCRANIAAAVAAANVGE